MINMPGGSLPSLPSNNPADCRWAAVDRKTGFPINIKSPCDLRRQELSHASTPVRPPPSPLYHSVS